MSLSFMEIERYIADAYQNCRVNIVPYSYLFTFSDVDANESVTSTLKINSNADFVVTGLLCASADNFEGTTLQIEDSATRERFFQNPIQLLSVASNSILSVEGNFKTFRTVPKNSTLTGTVVGDNLLANATMYVRLMGVSVFVYSSI